jgi:hypothetical protein
MTMSERITAELKLLRIHFPHVEYIDEGKWVKLPAIPLPNGWNKSEIDIAFRFPDRYPQNLFYGFFVPSGLRPVKGELKHFTDPAPASPPFTGTWAFFSGNPEPWHPAVDIQAGNNALTWIRNIRQRLHEGPGEAE